MPDVSVHIPQIGEGLQEARLVAMLKQPGDAVKRDEPIYQMETDKAVMDVESPYEGMLLEWLAEADAVLPIGAPVAKMRVAEGVEEAAAPSHGPAETAAPQASAPAAAADAGAARLRNVPPRSRAYAKEKGLTDEQLAAVAAKVDKVMPADIDAFLAAGPTSSATGYSETPMTGAQRILASRLQRGAQLVVPGTMSVATRWSGVEAARAAAKAQGSDFQPSAFTMFAFAVAQALKNHPMFRSTLVGDSTIRTYEKAHLGIAVALPGDQLVLAVVDDADHLSWREFADATRERIDLARGGKDQANESVALSLTNMQRHGLRDAIPVVVPPSVATLFLGEVYWGFAGETPEPVRLVNLGLTFDHRLINGVGAAEFLNEVKRNVENTESLIQP